MYSPCLSGDSILCEALQLLQSACKSLLTDDEYCTTEEVTSNLKAYASSISAINSSSVNSSAATFIRWHYEMLQNVIVHSQSEDSMIDQEKLWTNFHEIRTLPIFQSDWEKFLKLTNLEPDPLVYQRLSLESLTILIKQATPIQRTDTTAITVSDLTYEEANALRYIGGYIIRTLRESLKGNEDALGGLRVITNDDDDTTPAESEEWMCSIDRGGLIRITDEFYQTLCAIEYAVRRSLKVCSTVIPKTLAVEIREDSDVQFNWCMASAEMSDELSHLLLAKINKWITIRGFSFTNSIQKKTTKQHKNPSPYEGTLLKKNT